MKLLLRKSRGLTSVFLILILSSCIIASLAMIEVSSFYAGKSIVQNLCAVSGRSVLSEYNTVLFNKYGLFAIKNDESFLEDKFSFYIRNSLRSNKSIVHLHLGTCIIKIENNSNEDDTHLLNQINKISGSINNYIFSNFSHKFCQLDSSKHKLEIERIICGIDNDKANESLIQAEIYASLFAMHFANLMSNLDMPDECGVTIRDTLGNDLSIKEITIAISEEAAIYAARDVKAINKGEKVCFTNNGVTQDYDYADFLEFFLKLVLQNTKLKRLKELIEININEIEQEAFSFESSCFSFVSTAQFQRHVLSPFSHSSNSEYTVVEQFEYK